VNIGAANDMDTFGKRILPQVIQEIRFSAYCARKLQVNGWHDWPVALMRGTEVGFVAVAVGCLLLGMIIQNQTLRDVLAAVGAVSASPGSIMPFGTIFLRRARRGHDGIDPFDLRLSGRRDTVHLPVSEPDEHDPQDTGTATPALTRPYLLRIFIRLEADQKLAADIQHRPLDH
jgi:hypothetical protein